MARGGAPQLTLTASLWPLARKHSFDAVLGDTAAFLLVVTFCVKPAKGARCVAGLCFGLRGATEVRVI